MLGAEPGSGATGARAMGLWWVCAAGVAAVQVYLFHGYGIGDGFITARYAENLVARGEIAFNPGERVSALTSPLHMLWLSLGYALGGATAVFNKLASAVCVVLGALATASLFVGCPRMRVLSVCLVGLSPFLWLWTFSGLETAYVFAAVASFCWLMSRLEAAGTTWSLGSLGVAAGVLFLLRHDTVLLTVPACLFAVSRAPRPLAAGLRLLPGVALGVGWLVFAIRYFGDPLPTSFYVKTPGYNLAEFIRNGIYLAQFAVLGGIWSLWLAIPRGQPLRERGQTHARDSKQVPGQVPSWMPVAVGLLVVYWLGSATKHMMYAYRNLLPYLPLLVVVAHRYRTRPRPGEAGGAPVAGRWRLALGLCMAGQLALGFVVFDVAANPSLVGELRHRGAASQMNDPANEASREAVEHIRAHWRRQPASAVRPPRLFTHEAGVIPYYFREATIIDEALISYRHACRVSSRAAADYIEVWFPAWGPLGHQLAPIAPPAGMVWTRPVPRRDKAYRAVFFNPDPAPYILPGRTAGPCATPPSS